MAQAELLWAAAWLMLLGAAVGVCVRCQLSASKREKKQSERSRRLENQQSFEVIRSRSMLATTRRLEQIKEAENLPVTRKNNEELNTACRIGSGHRAESRYQNFLKGKCCNRTTGMSVQGPKCWKELLLLKPGEVALAQAGSGAGCKGTPGREHIMEGLVLPREEDPGDLLWRMDPVRLNTLLLPLSAGGAFRFSPFGITGEVMPGQPHQQNHSALPVDRLWDSVGDLGLLGTSAATTAVVFGAWGLKLGMVPCPNDRLFVLAEDCLQEDAAYVDPISFDYYNCVKFLTPPNEEEEDSYSYQNVIIGTSHSSDSVTDDTGDYENSAAIHIWKLQQVEESQDDEPDYVNTDPDSGFAPLSKQSFC
ncbi:linker for activation of T-cells family member 2-like [Rhea pennata]|uniref:linker for activation of T-cells family member 2-like n=1 Tax=Rhea pennata TaxID=8795 RepID=UPI002E268BE1